MTQTHAALAAAVLAIGGPLLTAVVAYALHRRGQRTASTVRTVPGALGVIAYRYCPVELRTRAAIVHADGTAACLDCNTHIPAGDS